MPRHPKDEPVTVRVVFKGLMLGCINTDTDNMRYEMGMIPCEGHVPSITKSTNGGSPAPIAWPAGRDLIIKVINPLQDGIRRYPVSPVGVVPEADFKLVLDVEGPDLHNRGININTEALSGKRIGVTAGLFYTHEPTVELDLYEWVNSEDVGTPVKHFGRIAKHTGVNIVCHEGADNGVAIIDASTGDTLPHGWMPALPDVTYELVVDNDCLKDVDAGTIVRPSNLPAGSDFRFLYQVMSPRDADDVRRFDFARTYATSGVQFFNPDTCNGSTGGGTRTIGLDWSHLLKSGG
jgi:hypothetical protein